MLLQAVAGMRSEVNVEAVQIRTSLLENVEEEQNKAVEAVDHAQQLKDQADELEMYVRDLT